MAKRPSHTSRLPADIALAIAEMREQIALATLHSRKGQPYYLSIGKSWLAIKEHPQLDKIGGIKGLRPLLPRSPQWLNRCAVAYDGQRTGDLEDAELWAKHNYRVRHEEEPYRMAEIVEAYRGRLKQARPRRLPLAITAGNFFIRSGQVKESFPEGTALLGDCDNLVPEIPDGVIDAVINDPPFGLWGVISHGYGKIHQPWDWPLDWDRLWPEIWRVLRPSGTVVIVAAEPLASVLVQSRARAFPVSLVLVSEGDQHLRTQTWPTVECYRANPGVQQSRA